MLILHVMPDSIYSKDYMDRINRLFDSNEHYFYIHSYKGTRKYIGDNVEYHDKTEWKDILRLINMVKRTKKVVLHSLYIDKKLLITFRILQVLHCTEFSWYIWSGDLYVEYSNECNITGIALNKRLKALFRRKLIYDLEKIIVVAPGDFEYAKKAYSTKAQMVQAEYSYNLIEHERIARIDNNSINILAGHSGEIPCQHFEMYDRIKACNNGKLEIYSILSYGDDQEHIQKVKAYGLKLFGKRYHPIMEWMSYNEYIELLNTIDVALIEGDCQMAAGNIFNLIFLGKKLFLSPKNSIYGKLLDKKITCFSKENIREQLNYPLTEDEKKKNHDIIKNMLSDETFYANWNQVFKKNRKE